ncbi:MAG: NIL domain-containing protein [Candidatus Margulisbacteria bacterium]|nr:NIL domain-containing protein [Candidatus Margulisiibacteriota bacterium]
MAKKAVKLVKLTFSQKLIKEPVIFTMAQKFDVMPNIRRARVTDKIGEMVLELAGEEKKLEKGIAYLIKVGVIVEPIVGDIIE